jgi:hypothetical protein
VSSPDVFTICLELLEWLEPDAGITKDPALWRPPAYNPDTLYLYPDTEDHVPYEAGSSVRQNFQLVVDIVLDDQGEVARGERDPAITDAIRKRVAAYAERVRLHQRGMTYDYLRVAGIRWQDLNGLAFRGARVRLAGYSLTE